MTPPNRIFYDPPLTWKTLLTYAFDSRDEKHVTKNFFAGNCNAAKARIWPWLPCMSSINNYALRYKLRASQSNPQTLYEEDCVFWRNDSKKTKFIHMRVLQLHFVCILAASYKCSSHHDSSIGWDVNFFVNHCFFVKIILIDRCFKVAKP